MPRPSLIAFALRRLLTILALVVLAPLLSFVVLGALSSGQTLWAQAGELPAYVDRTFLHFDLGILTISVAGETQPIADIVTDGLPVDLALVAGGLLLGVALGLAGGLLAGPRRGGALDRALLVGSAAALSVPVYWLGYMIFVFFAPQGGRYPLGFVSEPGSYVSPFHDPFGWLHAMWVPWLALALPVAAASVRMTRSALAEAEDDDALRTARGKGLRERTVLLRHRLPLALPAVISLTGVNAAALITNVALTEPTFMLPGAFRAANIGQFLGEHAHIPPFAVVQALIIEAAAIIGVIMLACDVLLTWLDPRMPR